MKVKQLYIGFHIPGSLYIIRNCHLSQLMMHRGRLQLTFPSYISRWIWRSFTRDWSGMQFNYLCMWMKSLQSIAFASFAGKFYSIFTLPVINSIPMMTSNLNYKHSKVSFLPNKIDAYITHMFSPWKLTKGCTCP